MGEVAASSSGVLSGVTLQLQIARAIHLTHTARSDRGEYLVRAET